MDFIAKQFKDKDVYYASDVNRLESQVEALTTALKSIMALNNVWISYEKGDEPPDKTMLWIDLSDSADGVKGEIESIFGEYNEVINQMSEEIKTLKKQIAILIAGGGVYPNPGEDDEDTNNYILLEDGLMLLLEDGSPLICEDDFEPSGGIVINNAILLEDGNCILTEEGSVLVSEA